MANFNMLPSTVAMSALYAAAVLHDAPRCAHFRTLPASHSRSQSACDWCRPCSSERTSKLGSASSRACKVASQSALHLPHRHTQAPRRVDRFEAMTEHLPEYRKGFHGLFYNPREDPDESWKAAHAQLGNGAAAR